MYYPGKYCNFEFKILEECSKEELFEREQYWIHKINPEYNCHLNTLPKYYKANHKKIQKRSWIQYHNYEKEKGYPANDALKENVKIYNAYHYISSKKRSILYSKGDTIYLIVGIGKKKKFYYLWSRMKVEEVDFLKDQDLIYNAFGDQYYLNPPQLLNHETYFRSFLKKYGNFAFGFTNITHHRFSNKLEKIAKEYRLGNDSISFQSFINNFEKHHEALK